MMTVPQSWMKPPLLAKLRATLALSAQLRQARRDPNAFVELCFRGVTQAKLHRDLQGFLSKQRRALIELPRDHGKTTQVCARLVWELGHNPSLRIILVCAAESLAVNRGRFLRDAIAENPLVRLVFPDLVPWRPWAVNAFAVERDGDMIGPSVAAFGIGGTSTGNRADLLVCDDIVDVKAVYSKAERDRVSDDFFNNLLNLLEPDGRFWGLCTPWHADDLNARLKRSGEFALFRKPIGKNLRAVWHERWSKKELVKRKKEIGAAAFARGYLLTPIADEELLIRLEWVRYSDSSSVSRQTSAAPLSGTLASSATTYDRLILSVDPAVSGKATADASGLVVLGQVENTIHCLAAIARRVTAPGLIEAIAELDAIWNPEVIVFESNGAFDAVRDLLVRHASFGPKVLGVVQSKAKAARVAAFSVSVQNGSFLVRKDQKELIDEMTTFPFGEHDDLLDAAATGTSYLLGVHRQPRMWDFAGSRDPEAWRRGAL